MKISISRSIFVICLSFFLLGSSYVFAESDILNSDTRKSEENLLSATINNDVSEDDTSIQTVKREWFIYYKTAKKIIAGPFDEVRGALNAWIDNPKIESKGKYYIGRNGVLFTNNPESYYKRQFDAILAERSELEKSKNLSLETQNPDETQIVPELTEKELKAQKKAEQKAEKERLRQEKKQARAAEKEKKRQEKLAAKYGTTYEPELLPENKTETKAESPENNKNPANPANNASNIENTEIITENNTTTATQPLNNSSINSGNSETSLSLTKNPVSETKPEPKQQPEIATKSNQTENKPKTEPKNQTQNSLEADNLQKNTETTKPWVPEPDLFSGTNRYEKKYLSDYIKSDVFTIPESPDGKTDFKEYEQEINETDAKGTTSLMNAVRESNDWKIKNLILAGADVNVRDKDGWTALMYAVRYQNNLSVINLLLEAGADVKAQNNYSLSALVIAACYNNNPDIIKKILSFYSPSDKEVQKAFVHLISTQTNDTVALVSKTNLFLDFGLPVNSYYDGKTPLMYACKYCKTTRVIKLLLDKNASLTLRSTDGKTAFDYAQENKSLPKDDIYWKLNKR